MGLQNNLKLQTVVLKTLGYADIFDYPLDPREVWRFLINDAEVGSEIVQKTLSLIVADCKLIDADGGLFFLKGRDEIIGIRKERVVWAGEKRKIAQRTADKLKMIPSIKMIGITGALAMDNTKDDDDIDLLIVASANSLWLTRFLIIVLCSFFGINRRKREETKVKDKICFNLFLDEDHLRIEPENLFLAHEIVQVKPIYDKGGIYEKFLRANEWTKKYLANAIDNSKVKSQKSKLQVKSQNFSFFTISCLNEFFYKLQFWYMKPKMTSEKVNLHQAFFHPGDLSKVIEKRYEEKVLKLTSSDRMM